MADQYSDLPKGAVSLNADPEYTDLPKGAVSVQPANPNALEMRAPDERESTWGKFKNAISHPIDYLSDVEEDTQEGGNRTIVGRALGYMQGRGDQGYAADHQFSPAVKSFMAGPIEGPPKLIRGTMRVLDPEAHMRERASGAHEALTGALQTAPVVAPEALTADTLIPRVIAGAGTQQAVEKGLGKMGVPNEYATVAGDVAGLTAAAPEKVAEVGSNVVRGVKGRYEQLAPRVKPVIERVSTPKNIATGVGSMVPGAHTVGGMAGRYGSEVLLGPERANEPLIKFKQPTAPEEPVVGQAQGLGRIQTQPLTPEEEAAPEVLRAQGLGKMSVPTPEASPFEGVQSLRTKMVPAKEMAGMYVQPAEEPVVEAPATPAEEPGNVKTLKAKGGKVVDTDPQNLQKLLEDSLKQVQEKKAPAKAPTLKPSDVTSGDNAGVVHDEANNRFDIYRNSSDPIGSITYGEGQKYETAAEAKKAAKAFYRDPSKIEELGIQAPASVEAAPDDLVSARNLLKDLRDAELVKFAEQNGVKPDSSFFERDANRHRTGRERFINKVLETMGPKFHAQVADAVNEFDSTEPSKMFTEADKHNVGKPARARTILDAVGRLRTNPSVSGGSQEAELTGPERRIQPRSKLLSADELQRGIEQRVPVRTPFDDTEGAMDTINRDIERRVPKPVATNASGESSASLENINRVASNKAKGLKTYRLNSLTGNATPILPTDAVDWHPTGAEHKITVDKNGNIEILESGPRARPMLKSSKINLPK